MKLSAGNLAKLYQYSSRAISAETRGTGRFDNYESIDYKGARIACLFLAKQRFHASGHQIASDLLCWGCVFPAGKGIGCGHPHKQLALSRRQIYGLSSVFLIMRPLSDVTTAFGEYLISKASETKPTVLHSRKK
jgi:hypothetical protein